MITDSMKELISRLIEITKDGKIKWESTALSQQYIVVLGDNAVCMSEDGEDIAVTIMKKDGEGAVKVIVKPSDEDYALFSQLLQLIQLKSDANQEMIRQLLEVINEKAENVNYSEINSQKG